MKIEESGKLEKEQRNAKMQNQNTSQPKTDQSLQITPDPDPVIQVCHSHGVAQLKTTTRTREHGEP